jgi:hypothetical protein
MQRNKYINDDFEGDVQNIAGSEDYIQISSEFLFGIDGNVSLGSNIRHAFFLAARVLLRRDYMLLVFEGRAGLLFV